MAFSQLDFIFIFLPVFLLVHCILPKQYRGLWMTIASLGFYVCGTIAHPEFILILVASLFVNYFAGRGLAKNGKGKKAIFALAVLYNKDLDK